MRGMVNITLIFSWIAHYKYFVIFPAAILEGPIVTVIAGFLASQGIFDLLIVYIVVVVADLIGDMLYYGVGRYGIKRIPVRIRKWIGVTDERIEKVKTHFDVHSGKTLILGKLTHSMGWAVLFGAGAAEMPIGKFLWFNLLGTLPKSLAFLLIGYYAGYAYQRINSSIDQVAFISMVVLVILLVIYFYYKKKRSQSVEIKNRDQ